MIQWTHAITNTRTRASQTCPTLFTISTRIRPGNTSMYKRQTKVNSREDTIGIERWRPQEQNELRQRSPRSPFPPNYRSADRLPLHCWHLRELKLESDRGVKVKQRLSWVEEEEEESAQASEDPHNTGHLLQPEVGHDVPQSSWAMISSRTVVSNLQISPRM